MWTLVDHDQQLRDVVEQVSGTSTYYLDTEFDSRADRTNLCLLQLHANDRTFLIDAQAIRDLRPLGAPLGRGGVTWVLHGAHQDIPLLTRALELDRPPRLFDTQIAWGMVGPEPATSFAYLTYRLLGSRNSKHHQADDWTRRPLSNSQLSYAAHDVNSLPPMHSKLLERVSALRREDAVHEACHDLLCGIGDAPESLSVESFRNAWQLEPAGQLALSELVAWFNTLSAEERERTLESKLLWSLANRMPNTVEALRQVRGMPRLPHSHLERILQIVNRALESQSTPSQLLEPPPYATFERLQVDAWVEYVRAVACTRAEVSRELVLAGRRLRQLKELVLKDGTDAITAQSLERILGPWQFSLIGDAVLWAASHVAAPLTLTSSALTRSEPTSF